MKYPGSQARAREMDHAGSSLTIEPMPDRTSGLPVIRSKNEILHILRALEKSCAPVALHFSADQPPFLTTIMGADEYGVWLDIGPKSRGDRHILDSREFALVSWHQGVKVQFVAHRIRNRLFGNREAYCLPLPTSLLRVQQRDFYRVQVPAAKPLTCTLPSLPGGRRPKRELPVTDISEGGVSLECDAQENDWVPGKLFQNCQITLPEFGTLTATLRVKSVLPVTLENGKAGQRAGCEFVALNTKLANLLQRYLARIQSQQLAQR